MHEMADYDLPAFVDKILETTGKPKLTLLGYSQGGGQIYYALARNQDWYADRVVRYVSMSAANYPR